MATARAPMLRFLRGGEEGTQRKVKGTRRDDESTTAGGSEELIFHPLGRAREARALAAWPRKACWCAQVHGRSNIATLSWPSKYCFLISIFPT
jgi:hypothetical protein